MSERSSAPPSELQHEDLRKVVENLRSQLAEAYRLVSLGRMVTGVVHEINNPIGSIVSNNEVSLRALESLKQKLAVSLQTGEPPAQKTLDLVDTLISLAAVDRIACDRISAVVRSLKTFSRIDEDEPRKARIGDLIHDAVKLVDCQFRRRIHVRTEIAELPEVECFPHMLSQVFLNLLVNAGQAIEGEGEIAITARPVDDNGTPWVAIAVADSGKGIAKEHQERIFSSGFTTKPVGVGTGLGLALSKRIVEESHGGRIWFDSEPGMGTTFHLRIPVHHQRRPQP